MDSTPTPDSTPRRGAPRAVLVSAMALGLAAGGYGLASAASGGGDGATPSSSSPEAVQQTAPSGDTWTPVQSETAPGGYGQGDGRTGPNGEDCDPADGRGSSGGTDGYGGSGASSTTPSSGDAADTSLGSDAVQTPF